MKLPVIKRVILTLFCLFGVMAATAKEKSVDLSSPSGDISLHVDLDSNISYSVTAFNQDILKRATIGLELNGVERTENFKVKKIKRSSVDDIFNPALSYKNKSVRNHYNGVTITLNSGISLEFRLFDNGVAYRFISDISEEVTINEKGEYTFAENLKMWSSKIDEYVDSYEEPYTEESINIFPTDSNTYLPLLMGNAKGVKILMTDADLYNYPNMFLTQGGNNTLKAIFPPYPLETKMVEDRRSKVTEGADYIAKSSGSRSYPWRVMGLASEDKDLISNEMVMLLSRDGNMEDTSWIKPGKVSWEWWNASNLYDVDFEAGYNTESYKYYIDFAAESKLEYIILDEGWSISTRDLSAPNSVLDLKELIRYGNEKGVRIILWATWQTLNRQWFVLDSFKEWGVAGIKVDFMDRADQWMVEFYEKAAKECAARELLIDFHGAFKPSGMRRAYPNIISHEGIHGLENTKWATTVTPKNNVTIPFIRMFCGPMDYTPGAMNNFQEGRYTPLFERPGSIGTRCHQLGLFITYETGIQMLCDSPSNYKKEPESTRFISSVPVEWDETRVLKGEVGKYIVVARRSGDRWFLGALNGGEDITLSVDISFMKGTKHAVLFQDGINANNFAQDYKRTEKFIDTSKSMIIEMARGGGFAARFE